MTLADGALTVADEGPGIEPADLPHIFDRFYRSQEARTLPGSGLGLSIVKRAAERHGGTAEVSSTLGKGTTFTLTMPPRPPPGRLSTPVLPWNAGFLTHSHVSLSGDSVMEDNL